MIDSRSAGRDPEETRRRLHAGEYLADLVDPLVSTECSRQALDHLVEHDPRRAIVALALMVRAAQREEEAAAGDPPGTAARLMRLAIEHQRSAAS